MTKHSQKIQNTAPPSLQTDVLTTGKNKQNGCHQACPGLQTQNSGWGSAPCPAGGANSALTDPLAKFLGREEEM